MSPWLSLHADLVQLVGWRLLATGDLLDYVRFRAVCKYWRSSAAAPSGRGIVDPRFHPRRWMLLPEGHGLHPDDGRKKLFNLSTGLSVCTWLSLPSDYRILDSVDGLLLVQWGKQDSAAIRLLHPFTGDFADLPPLMSLVRARMNMSEHTRHRQWVNFQSVTSISVSAGEVVAVMIKISDIPVVFFATTKDQQWDVSTWSFTPYSTTVALQGKLYTLDSRIIHGGAEQIFQIDPPQHENDGIPSSLLPPKLIGTCPMDKIRGGFTMAECDSEILLIGHNAQMNSRNRMLVYRVSDVIMGNVVPVTSIGGKALFLTINNNISSQGDDICVYLRETMTFGFKAIPNMVGDTILRRQRMKHDSPAQYELGSGEWSTPTFLWCEDGDHDCNCSLVHHIYGCCHCAFVHMRKLARMELER
jgi:hypothetical protein